MNKAYKSNLYKFTVVNRPHILSKGLPIPATYAISMKSLHGQGFHDEVFSMTDRRTVIHLRHLRWTGSLRSSRRPQRTALHTVL